MFIEEEEQEVCRSTIKETIEIALHRNPPPLAIKVEKVLHVRPIPQHPKRGRLVDNARRDLNLHRGVVTILLERILVVHVGVKLALRWILRTREGRRVQQQALIIAALLEPSH